MRPMIEFLGFFYDVAKDIKDYLGWSEDVKVVDREWLENPASARLCET